MRHEHHAASGAVGSAKGVVFDGAHSTAPWTLPSHASMFTGRYASETGADWTSPMDTTPPTLAEAFRDAGYATAGFVANIAYTGYHTGLGRGFIRYEDTKRTFGETPRHHALADPVALPRPQHLGGDALAAQDGPGALADLLRAAFHPAQARR